MAICTSTSADEELSEVGRDFSLASLSTLDLSFLDEVFEFDEKFENEKSIKCEQSRRVPMTSLPLVNQLLPQSVSLTVNSNTTLQAMGGRTVPALQNAAQAKASGDSNLLFNSPGPSQSWPLSLTPDSVLNVDPGLYGFKVCYPPNKYDSSTNTLFLRRNEPFPATIQFSSRGIPKDCLVRALVSYRSPQDVLKLETCRRCLNHSAEADSSKPWSNHFLVSTNSKAYYGVHLSHNVVTVPLNDLLMTDAGPTCVYNGNELGTDVVNLLCCFNTKRQRDKHQKTVMRICDGKDLSPPSSKFRQLKDHNNKDPDLDEEGYYNFTWRGKDKVIFDILTLIKKGYNNGPWRQ